MSPICCNFISVAELLVIYLSHGKHDNGDNKDGIDFTNESTMNNQISKNLDRVIDLLSSTAETSIPKEGERGGENIDDNSAINLDNDVNDYASFDHEKINEASNSLICLYLQQYQK